MVTAEALDTDVDPFDRLHDLGHIPPLRQYLHELWGRREFAVAVPINDIRVQNMDTFFGQFWHLLNPALTIGVYFVVFNVILDVSRGVDNYLAFLVSGFLVFTLSTQTMTQSITSISNNEGLIRSVQFPRAILPISVVITQHLLFVPTLFVLMATMLITGEAVTLRWLALPPLLVAQLAFDAGGSFVAARAGFAFPDLSQIVGHMFRLLFYASGVLFSVDWFVEEQYVPWFALNPFYSLVTVTRWVFLTEIDSIDPLVVVSLASWALILPVVGLVFFVRGEHRYGA